MKTIKEILKENPQYIEEEPILIGSFLDIDMVPTTGLLLAINKIG